MRLLPVLLSLSLLVGAAAARKTTTHLNFYLHDIVTAVPSRPETAVRVARGVTPLPVDPTKRFGDMYVIDDPLTEGPDAASPAVGTAQGFYILASRTDIALLFTVNLVFTAGPHKGSTIAVHGRDAVFDPVRELPVVGGTGVFRGATGYGLFQTYYSVDNATFNAVLQVDMYVSARSRLSVNSSTIAFMNKMKKLWFLNVD
ncbi:dirigent protein 1-like [Lolium rigidum]|uniref:dirigent protein 1-like n=1 Tax=Lolium rigidum TaxID=89674 RepID=UPI001F5D686A|nr:dirigent protein 1-like [Lolium rigidum]